MRKNKLKKGFTLTEIIIVIAIIGILAAVLIPSLTGYIKKARLSNDTQDAANMTTLLNAYLTDNYDVDVDNLNASDIRSIISEQGKTYTFIPKLADEGYSFWYSKSEKKIIVSKGSDLKSNVSAEELVTEPEDFISGYSYLDVGGSVLAEKVYSFRQIKSSSDFSSFMNLFDSNKTDINILSKIKGFKSTQIESIASFFKTTYTLDNTAFVSDFTSYLGNGVSKKNIIFSDGIVSIPDSALKGISEITSKIHIPYSVKFIENNAFSTITSTNEITFSENKPQIKIDTNSFSESLKTKNSILTEFTTIINRNLDEKIEFQTNYSETQESSNVLASGNTETTKYVPYTVGVNPNVVVKDDNGNVLEKYTATKIRFSYHENDDGTTTIGIKMYDDDGVIGTKEINYKVQKDLNITLENNVLSFENFASTNFDSSKIRYEITIGTGENTKTYTVESDNISGNIGKVSLGDLIELTESQLPSNEDPAPSGFPFYGDKVSNSDGTIITQVNSFDYSKNSINYYFEEDKKNIYKIVDSLIFNQTITNYKVRIAYSTSIDDYDVSYSLLNIAQQYVSSKYSLKKYFIDNNYFVNGQLPISIKAYSVDEASNQEKLLVEKNVFEDMNTNYEYYDIVSTANSTGLNSTSFTIKSVLRNVYNVGETIKDSEYMELYDKNKNHIRTAFVLPLQYTFDTGKNGPQTANLYYEITGFDTTQPTDNATLKLSVITKFFNSEGKIVNPDVDQDISYQDIELTYRVRELQQLEITKINNRILNGTGTEDNPFIFCKNEQISYNGCSSFTGEGISETTLAKGRYILQQYDELTQIWVDCDNNQIDTQTLTADNSTRKFRYYFTYNDSTMGGEYFLYGYKDIYYQVVDKLTVTPDTIYERTYDQNNPFVFYEGEQVVLLNGFFKGKYYLNNTFSDINFYLFSFSSNYNDIENCTNVNVESLTNTYKNTSCLSSLKVGKQKTGESGITYLNIDYNNCTANSNFVENETGTLYITYYSTSRSRIDYASPYTDTGVFIYEMAIPYTVKSGDFQLSSVTINQHAYNGTNTDIISLRENEFIANGSGTSITYYYPNISSIQTFGVTNSLFDQTNNQVSDPVNSALSFYLMKTENDANPFAFDSSYIFKKESIGEYKYIKIVSNRYGKVISNVFPFAMEEDSCEVTGKNNTYYVNVSAINGERNYGQTYEFVAGSTLGISSYTQIYYESTILNKLGSTLGDSATYSTIQEVNGKNQTVYVRRMSFKLEGEDDSMYRDGDEITFTSSLNHTGTLFVRYYNAETKLTYYAQVPYKTVTSKSTSASIVRLNYRSVGLKNDYYQYHSTVNQLNPFIFYYGENLTTDSSKTKFATNYFGVQIVENGLSQTFYNDTSHESNFKYYYVNQDNQKTEITMENNLRFGIDTPNEGKIVIEYTYGQKVYTACVDFMVMKSSVSSMNGCYLYMDENSVLEFDHGEMNSDNGYLIFVAQIVYYDSNSKTNRLTSCSRSISTHDLVANKVSYSSVYQQSMQTATDKTLAATPYDYRIKAELIGTNQIKISVQQKLRSDPDTAYAEYYSFTKEYILTGNNVSYETMNFTLESNPDHILNDSTHLDVSYTAVKGLSKFTIINNRYLRFNDTFEFFDGESFYAEQNNTLQILNETKLGYSYSNIYNSYLTYFAGDFYSNNKSQYNYSIYMNYIYLWIKVGDEYVKEHVRAIDYFYSPYTFAYNSTDASKNEGSIRIDVKNGEVWYSTSVDFTISSKTAQDNAKDTSLSRINKIYYYDDTSKILLLKNEKINLLNSSIKFLRGDNFYENVSDLRNTSYYSYKVTINDEEKTCGINSSNELDYDFSNLEVGTVGKITIIYHPSNSLTYECSRDFEIIAEQDAIITKINERNVVNNSRDNLFTVYNGETLFVSTQTYNSCGFQYQNRLGVTMVRGNMYSNNTAYQYYQLPFDKDLSSLWTEPLGTHILSSSVENTYDDDGHLIDSTTKYVYDLENSNYLEAYNVDPNSICFTNTNSDKGQFVLAYLDTGVTYYAKLFYQVVEPNKNVTSTKLTVTLKYAVEGKEILVDRSISSASLNSNDYVLKLYSNDLIRMLTTSSIAFDFGGQSLRTIYLNNSNIIVKLDGELYQTGSNVNKTFGEYGMQVGKTGTISIEYTLYGITYSKVINYEIIQ